METNVKLLQSILVPYDYTSVGKAAIEQALLIAKPTQAEVIVLHVSSDKTRQNLEKEIEIFTYDKLNPLVVNGDIYSTINDVAVQKGVDLIIMGTHGKKGMQKLFGSNAIKVLDSTDIPLMVIQEGQPKQSFENILFPVSLKDEDRQKTASAVKLARMFGSKIHIFPRYESTKTGEKKMVNAILQIKQYFNKFDVKFEVAPLLQDQENFQKKIIAYAGKIKADLILIINDSTDHLPLISPKEEDIIFNKLQTPVMCIHEQKIKRASFSAAGG